MENARNSLRRRNYEVMKNDLSVELTNITNDSRRLQNDLRSSNEDFFMMCKSMSDRQANFLTRLMLLEEKYGELIAMIDGTLKEGDGEASGENVVLPTAYAASFNRFSSDASYSLKDHAVLMEQEQKEMAQLFATYNAIWIENMKVFGERARAISTVRTKLAARLTKFNSCVHGAIKSD